MGSRRMVKLIHADQFFPNDDVHNLRQLVQDLNFVQKPHGMEVPNFQLVFPDSEIIFNKVLGERVTVDPKRSGVFRRPNNNAIHFEEFDSTEEWCFVVALENTTVNFWYHTDPKDFMGDLATADAKSVLDGHQFNYNNLFEWRIHSNILLEPNQCLFFRPWVFHSLANGLVQYYRLIADNKFRILVMGMPNSCKTEISHLLAQQFEDATVLTSMTERAKAKDIDFSQDGQMRHCYRMLNLARASPNAVTIIDMACPLAKMRQILNPDILIWCSNSSQSQHTVLNHMYEPPEVFDIECVDSSDSTIQRIVRQIVSKRT